MTAPIINQLTRTHEIRITIRSTLPEPLLRSRIDGEFEVISTVTDFGMQMHDSFRVDLEKSADDYLNFHQNYSERLEEESRALKAVSPDLILANIPYLTIEAAAQCGIPCVAYCSLNWLEIFDQYFSNDMEESDRIKKQIRHAYNQADSFFCPEPSMDMPDLNNVTNVGPVARQNHEVINLQKLLGVSAKTKVVLIAPGGVPTEISVHDWPKYDDIVWVCSWKADDAREDVVLAENLNLSFNQILANADAVISKAGYGTVTETVCNGVPALYVKRGDWPEEPFLLDWWMKNGNVLEINRSQLYGGNIRRNLNELWQMAYRPMKNPTGIAQICQALSKYIEKPSS